MTDISKERNRVELYKYLLDILADYQLPGGKLDGHRLITDLANAKLYPQVKSELQRLREQVRVPRPCPNCGAVIAEAVLSVREQVP